MRHVHRADRVVASWPLVDRRGWLALAGSGLLAAALPRLACAQTAPERDHRLQLELPILAEDAAAVPIQVSVDHPMEPDHFIRWIDVRIDRDPVPHKGRLVFTPASGRAFAAFTFRSGTGGVVKATAECSRHGQFTATREVRVADGGCATGSEVVNRDRMGQPQLRVARPGRAGEVVEIRTKVDFPSHTGLATRGGKIVRDAPELYIRQAQLYLDDQLVTEFQMTSAVSPNPMLRLPLRAAKSGTVRAVFVSSEGQRWETTQPVRV